MSDEAKDEYGLTADDWLHFQAQDWWIMGYGILELVDDIKAKGPGPDNSRFHELWFQLHSSAAIFEYTASIVEKPAQVYEQALRQKKGLPDGAPVWIPSEYPHKEPVIAGD